VALSERDRAADAPTRGVEADCRDVAAPAELALRGEVALACAGPEPPVAGGAARPSTALVTGDAGTGCVAAGAPR